MNQNTPAPEKSKIDALLAEKTKIQLVDNTREITGKITQISENTLKVEADVVNIPKILEAESVNKLPVAKKTFTVKTDDKTEFFGLKFQELKVGKLI